MILLLFYPAGSSEAITEAGLGDGMRKNPQNRGAAEPVGHPNHGDGLREHDIGIEGAGNN